MEKRRTVPRSMDLWRKLRRSHQQRQRAQFPTHRHIKWKRQSGRYKVVFVVIGLAVFCQTLGSFKYSLELAQNQVAFAPFGITRSNINEKNKWARISTRPRRRSVVLLGPIDRFNFGDLLFEKIASKLLTIRAGYKDDQLLRAGIVSVDMSEYGGHSNIMGIDKIQEMSRSSSLPFDIVYLGGQALACPFDIGLDMIPAEVKEKESPTKTSDCAYLLSKRHLVPASSSSKNRAIVNSMGGSGTVVEDCAEAVQMADYVAFRDHPDNTTGWSTGIRYQIRPDSAVMTRELFQEEIEAQDLSTILHQTNGNYIAVQHKVKGMNYLRAQTKLAQALDHISAQSNNATIVFFVAGTVKYHDSFQVYDKIQSKMIQPAIVHRRAHIWETVAVVANAKAVLGTSLHVRIMAFIHFKPRVTWCSEVKHQNFLQLWDAPDASHCVQKYDETWKVLHKYMGPTAQMGQEKTKETYKNLVNLYMQGFDEWSNILDT